MSGKVGRNKNIYTEISGSDTELNTTNYVQIAPPSPSLMGYRISNISSHDIVVKEQAFDNPDTTTELGFIVFKRSVYESIPDQFARGGLSAIALTGNPTIKFMEF